MDIGLLPQSLATTNATGSYLSLKDFGMIAFVMITGAIAATKTAVLQIMQAKTAAGGSAKALTGATVTVTACDESVSASADLTSVANTDVVTVNGVDFTKAAATDASANEFADADGLVTCINAYFDTLVASAATNTVTITSVDGKADVTLSKTENAGTITLATVSGIGMVEVRAEDLDLENGFEYVAAKITTDATIVAGAVAVRSQARRDAEQIGETDYA